MKQSSFKFKGDEDLRIVDHLAVENLPEVIQSLLPLAHTSAERDMLLMSVLSAASSCMPTMYFRYGETGKKYWGNMQCFIVAGPACGKGIAHVALEMIRVVDAVHPLLIPGDSTLPAWYQRLLRQRGRGYMHESEGSVITDIWKGGAASYNTALRKAAEHEPISRNRCNGKSEIPCPQLSMLVTGTFGQYRQLVPSIENGYFSRLLTLVIRDVNGFDRRYVMQRSNRSALAEQAGKRLLRIYEQQMDQGEAEWTLTEEQKDRLGCHLESSYSSLINQLGENFHSVVVRMAIHIERIAMVLSGLRKASFPALPLKGEGEEGRCEGELICTDADYETAEMIGNKLLLHMASAYRLIGGEDQEAVPESVSVNQKEVLFEQLGNEYAHKELVQEAQLHGISRATAIRWNDRWLLQGKIEKIQYGKYKKII